MDKEQAPIAQIEQRARERMGELRARIDALTQELQEIQAFLRMLPRFSEEEPTAHRTQTAFARVRAIAADLPKARTVTNEVARMLKERGGQMRVRELLSLLDGQGFGELIKGEDEIRRTARLSTMLSEDERFYANRLAGWGLRPQVDQEPHPAMVHRRVTSVPVKPDQEQE